MYVGDKNPNKKDEDKPVAAAPGSPTESAAITMAKQAAKDVMNGVEKKDKDPKKNTDLELEQSADLESAQKLEELEKNSQEAADAGLSRQFSLIEDTSQVIEEQAGKKDDLAVPNWPKYSDPLTQRAEIEKELKQVKKQEDEFKKNSEEAEKLMKDTSKKEKTEFEQKQKQIDLQHKVTVNKIKSDIWGDRFNFL